MLLACVLILTVSIVSAAEAMPLAAQPLSTGVTVDIKTADKTVQLDNAGLPAKPVPVSTEKKIGINLASRILILYEGSTKIRMYPVGVGKTTTPTPTGFYYVQNKEMDPTWIDPDDTSIRIPSGPENPLGYRWIGFYGTYGIHGTNRPGTVGSYVSNGCVRMHEEDVEDLYPLVRVGTPVTVYYDRIVIDSAPDHTVAYYIYPDGYGWQQVSVQDVKKALAGYGVENFAEAPAIAAKIGASDGLPAYVAKAYDLIVDGRRLSQRALEKDGILYVPAVSVATALRLDLHWNGSGRVLTSPYGTAPGIVKSDVVYVKGTDAAALFHVMGQLTSDLQYVMVSVRQNVSEDKGPQKKTEPASAVPVKQQTKQKTA